MVKIRDINKHPEPQEVFQTLDDSAHDSFFQDHMPIAIGEQTMLVYKDGFCNVDKRVVRAILNGFPIDTQNKTHLTDEHLEE